jgi:hypothetical protein
VLWLVWFVFKLSRRLWLLLAAAAAGFAAGLLLQARAEQRSWAVVRADAERQLVGDDLIPAADTVDTRSLRIEAPPEQVWPWIVQMGWGRGGWYSYDKMDMDRPSAQTILDEFQSLSPGETVPMYPEGGFEARVVEPPTALVLYLDTELVRAQAAAAEDGRTADGAATPGTPKGLEAVGAMSELTMPDFRVSWAFVLEPAAGGGTRLIERLRLWTAPSGVTQRLGMPFVGLGVFLMTRKHMLGLKERVERHAPTEEV